MKAVIPAGGEGSRLFPYTNIIPKALLPVGGKPVIWWIISRLRQHDIEKVYICMNEEHKPNFLHELRDCPIPFEIGTNKSPSGSAGEILNMEHDINEPFLLHFSDEFTPIDLTELMKWHKASKGIATLAVIRNVPLEVGILDLPPNQSKILGFREKPMLNQPAWAGIAVFEPEIFSYINKGDDFARDVFPRVLKHGESIYAYQSDALWLDIGSLGHYKRACELAKQGKL